MHCTGLLKNQNEVALDADSTKLIIFKTANRWVNIQSWSRAYKKIKQGKDYKGEKHDDNRH